MHKLEKNHRIIITKCDLLTAYDEYVNKNQLPAGQNGDENGKRLLITTQQGFPFINLKKNIPSVP